MAIIKTVTNGSGTATFRAVSLGHVISIFFGLVSIIGSQQTWLWSAAHERDSIVTMLRMQITTDIEKHEQTEERRFDEIEGHLADINRRLDAMFEREANLEQQVNRNTGIIEHMYPK
jgi:hypothetical protein